MSGFFLARLSDGKKKQGGTAHHTLILDRAERSQGRAPGYEVCIRPWALLDAWGVFFEREENLTHDTDRRKGWGSCAGYPTCSHRKDRFAVQAPRLRLS